MLVWFDLIIFILIVCDLLLDKIINNIYFIYYDILYLIFYWKIYFFKYGICIYLEIMNMYNEYDLMYLFNDRCIYVKYFIVF